MDTKEQQANVFRCIYSGKQVREKLLYSGSKREQRMCLQIELGQCGHTPGSTDSICLTLNGSTPQSALQAAGHWSRHKHISGKSINSKPLIY